VSRKCTILGVDEEPKLAEEVCAHLPRQMHFCQNLSRRCDQLVGEFVCLIDCRSSLYQSVEEAIG
jgi:hypothetical protein